MTLQTLLTVRPECMSLERSPTRDRKVRPPRGLTNRKPKKQETENGKQKTECKSQWEIANEREYDHQEGLNILIGCFWSIQLHSGVFSYINLIQIWVYSMFCVQQSFISLEIATSRIQPTLESRPQGRMAGGIFCKIGKSEC